MKYSIPETNIVKLSKILISISKKIEKFGGTLTYNVLGNHYEDIEVNGQMKKFLMYDIEVEGHILYKGWEYCASVEKTDKGNIIISKGGHEIPDKYYYGEPVCDHCKSVRYRRFTFVIRNVDTGEYKQVGRACLEEYTNGLNAETIAEMLQFFEDLDKMSKSRSNEIYYENLEDLLIKFQAYCDNHKISYKRICYFADPETYTGNRELTLLANGNNDYREALETWTPRKVNGGRTPKDFYSCFTADAIVVKDDKLEDYRNLVERAKNWYASQEDDRGQMFHNYKTLFSQEYIPFEDVGILCNGFVAYGMNEAYHTEDYVKCEEIRKAWLVKREEERKIEEEQERLRQEVLEKEDEELMRVYQFYSDCYEKDLGAQHCNLTLWPVTIMKSTYYRDENNVIYKLDSDDFKDACEEGADIQYLKDPIDVKFAKLCYMPVVSKAYTHSEKYRYDEHSFRMTLEFTYYILSLRDYDRTISGIITKHEEGSPVLRQFAKYKNQLDGYTSNIKEEFIGKEHERVDVVLADGFTLKTVSAKGVSLYEGLDKQGRRLGTWTKKYIPTGVAVRVRGTIWNLNEYKGQKSTIINLIDCSRL